MADALYSPYQCTDIELPLKVKVEVAIVEQQYTARVDPQPKEQDQRAMSLNGLDDVKVKEAYETAAVEPGGWVSCIPDA